MRSLNSDGWFVRFIKRHVGRGAKRMTFGMVSLFIIFWLLTGKGCDQGQADSTHKEVVTLKK